jgi:hypothetical protein
LTIELKGANIQMNDVVVVGYGTQKKANLTGAVDQISGREIGKPVICQSQYWIAGNVAKFKYQTSRW